MQKDSVKIVENKTKLVKISDKLSKNKNEIDEMKG